MKKHTLKRMLAATIAVVMVLAMIPFSTIIASAATPTTYSTITAGSSASVTISNSGESMYFQFVPTVSGIYTFYSSNYSGDPHGSLLDENGNVLISNDDNGSYNFSFEYECVANTTYYVQAYMHSSSSTGYYTLNVSNAPAPIPTGTYQVSNGGVYSLFNSGSTSSYGNGGTNSDDSSYTNAGYDIYASYSGQRTVNLGLSFTVTPELLNRGLLNAQTTIYAYDVDEGSGERDVIYLVDETNGHTRVAIPGYLHGMDGQWNTTTLDIDPSLLEAGHTYHLELTETVSGWVVWVRTVSIEFITQQSAVIDADISATIDDNGNVTADVNARSDSEIDCSLEFSATKDGDQRGSATGTIVSNAIGASTQVVFALESGAPSGVYTIEVVITNAQGNVLTTRSCTVGYRSSAVNYSSNGGVNYQPIDNNAYYDGDTVTVLFDRIPVRNGFVFLGWSTDSNATAPMYTEDGTNSFVIGDNVDVTLYAVWKADTCEGHIWSETSRTDASCTTYGEIVYTCSVCGGTMIDLVEPIQHDFNITNTVDATCTNDGYVEYTCQRTGCGETKRQILNRLNHDFGDDDVCDICGYVLYNHTHEYVSVVVAPTCTAMGYTEYTCSCGHVYRDTYVQPVRHNWDAGQITSAATCTVDGVMTYTCQDCFATKTTIIEAAHLWIENITLEKTCTTDGSVTKTCSVCGVSVIEVIPAGHDWDAGVETIAATCTTEGLKTCSCLECGATEDFVIHALGHYYVDGVCTRCGEKFIDNVTPSTHPLYGMYFEIDDILSDYGPSLIDEYGLLLDYNADANLEKVGVYLTQDGTMWRRCIAVRGTNITYATYVPYLAYQTEIKYTGLNHAWINTFSLKENSSGVWCYSNYATIGANLEDAYGNLLLSLYDIGQAGAQTRIFDDLDEMIAWLDHECVESEWIIDTSATCVAGSKHKECIECHAILETAEIPPVAEHVFGEWINYDADNHVHSCACGENEFEDHVWDDGVVTKRVTPFEDGEITYTCDHCAAVKVEIIPIPAVFPYITVDSKNAAIGSTVTVNINMLDNPGISSMRINVAYDSAVLTLIDVAYNTDMGGLNVLPENIQNVDGNLILYWTDGFMNYDQDGVFATLTFAVAADAPVNTSTAISVTYDSEDIHDIDENNVTFYCEDGEILFYMPGDINGDGVLNSKDTTRLMKYLAGFNVEVNEAALDVNGDGVVNTKDTTRLMRYLANWDVEIF